MWQHDHALVSEKTKKFRQDLYNLIEQYREDTGLQVVQIGLSYQQYLDFRTARGIQTATGWPGIWSIKYSEESNERIEFENEHRKYPPPCHCCGKSHY